MTLKPETPSLYLLRIGELRRLLILKVTLAQPNERKKLLLKILNQRKYLKGKNDAGDTLLLPSLPGWSISSTACRFN